MDIFIRRLPESVTRLGLINYLSSSLRSHWNPFSNRHGKKILGCEIFRIIDRKGQTVEYHGIAHIEPAKDAVVVIERLNGTRLKDKTMEVRKFYHRSSLRDQRHEEESLPADVWERRKRDRRRSRLQIEPLHAGATRAKTVLPLPQH